ncbi:MAG: hypothetical protein LQ343_004664 [Gyalolechia ehrenbergii]|nr:MAG: hypothetical protein LQ343_004664 [Gyalolechia ehrenbergii]
MRLALQYVVPSWNHQRTVIKRQHKSIEDRQRNDREKPSTSAPSSAPKAVADGKKQSEAWKWARKQISSSGMPLGPGMVCTLEHHPVAAVVMHTPPMDIELAIVNGEVRTEKGVLTPARGVDLQISGWLVDMVAGRLLESRRKVQGRIEKVDFGGVREGYIRGFGLIKGYAMLSLGVG